MVSSNCRARFKRKPFRGKIGILLGFTLSFLALILPFYNIEKSSFNSGYHNPVTSQSTHYWSFKSSAKTYYSLTDFFRRFGLDQPFYVSWVRDIVEAPSYSSLYFDAYWFNLGPDFGGLSELFITLFAMQLLTLGTELSSLLIRSKAVRLGTVLPGAVVVCLMLYVAISLGLMSYTVRIDLDRFSGSLRLGFWLATLAEIIFAIDLALRTNGKVVKHELR